MSRYGFKIDVLVLDSSHEYSYVSGFGIGSPNTSGCNSLEFPKTFSDLSSLLINIDLVTAEAAVNLPKTISSGFKTLEKFPIKAVGKGEFKLPLLSTKSFIVLK